MSPQRADLVLTSDVPDIEFGVFVRNGFYVEADSGDSRDVLVELELIQNSYTETPSASPRNTHERGYGEGYVLVLPAASSPSIRSLISLDPKILFIIFDIDAPIVSVQCGICGRRGRIEPCSKGIRYYEAGYWRKTAEAGSGSRVLIRRG